MKRSVAIAALAVCSLRAADTVRIGVLSGGETAVARQGADGWKIAVEAKGAVVAIAERPLALEFYRDGWRVAPASSAYASFSPGAGGSVGKAVLRLPGGVEFAVEDTWTVEGPALHIARVLTVKGQAAGGFMSALTFTTGETAGRDALQFFAPGMIYGTPDHLTPVAIGGRETYMQGSGIVRIREDRLPAPLFGVRFPGGRSISVMNAKPRADTVPRDSRDLDVATQVDERFSFGAVGVEPRDGTLACGFWFPGTEGEVTYRGRMYPGGQVHGWRGRYHPMKDGLVQRYELAFRFGSEASLPAYYREAWRWAWNTLKPAVNVHDIEQVRRSLIDTLATQIVRSPDGKVGLPNAVSAAPPENRRAVKAVMGFTGKCLESAEHMLQEASRDRTERGERLRKLAGEIFDTFTRMKVSPPDGEGFLIENGKPVTARWPREDVVYLRSFGDDLKATLRAVKRERREGREHPEWLTWTQRFADWLLAQQRPDGSFPRSWRPVTGAVADQSPQSSYNPVPFLMLLSDLTKDPKYRAAAIRAAEYSWSAGQAAGKFVGGTIDNPDVIDKEAGTLSLEAYLAVYESTKDPTWLGRARAAADFSETWIYIWNVPMPEGENDSEMHWKRGVSTVGLQLIATGHSLTDQYMAFDADEYAKLSVYSKDSHYLDVARILLHNTKSMLALPGRAFDLNGPGWQQEHWSMAPMRGYGIHRLWLPWVSTSHLNGIVGLEEFDAALFRKLSEGK